MLIFVQQKIIDRLKREKSELAFFLHWMVVVQVAEGVGLIIWMLLHYFVKHY